LRRGQGLGGGPAQPVEDRGEDLVDVGAGRGEQADAGGLGGVEALPGEVVAGQGARVGAGQQRQGDDGRGDADADLGEGERGVVGGGGDVAGGEQAEPAGADVPGDPGDDG